MTEVFKNKSYKRPEWQEFWFTQAILWAQRSIDASSQIGCVIVDHEETLLTAGYNGPCRNIEMDPTDPRLNERPEKYFWFEHGERNAIYNANRNGTNLRGASLYILGIPCTDCARGIIQTGISTVYILKSLHELWMARQGAQWGDKMNTSEKMFEMAGVSVVYVDVKPFVSLPIRVGGETYLIEGNVDTFQL